MEYNSQVILISVESTKKKKNENPWDCIYQSILIFLVHGHITTELQVYQISIKLNKISGIFLRDLGKRVAKNTIGSIVSLFFSWSQLRRGLM